ncbi:hypothetical protein EIB75_11655 [Epilithonimonas vandammei]|uniref:Uncharacterized protein n=1 Tax=Epilithonimonas vandammei TaxID=2487072 RepID=A0A3G8ZPH4_9FLAO|nr:hypothetical protein EIB75_11655 [Epilithonimonas vandammei]
MWMSFLDFGKISMKKIIYNLKIFILWLLVLGTN